MQCPLTMLKNELNSSKMQVELERKTEYTL